MNLVNLVVSCYLQTVTLIPTQTVTNFYFHILTFYYLLIINKNIFRVQLYCRVVLVVSGITM